jgi:hypothetical protein
VSQRDPLPSVDNPFSTRRVKPGAIAYVFPPGEDLSTLLERLRRSAWRGQLVGPHGSGKSTLLAALRPALELSGRRPLCLTLHDGQRRLPVDLARSSQMHPSSIVIVDGYEQLSRWNRWRLQWLCRRRGWGLIVSSHRDTGLPDLLRVSVDLDRAGVIVRRLLGTEHALIGDGELAQYFTRHRGDLREMLMELYDVYEERKRI